MRGVSFKSAIGAAAALAVLTATSLARDFSANGVTVSQPWARATPGGAKTGAVFMAIAVAAGASDRLIGVETPIAGRAEIHSHVEEGGVMKMRRVDGVAIDGGKALILGPGGYHIMLMALTAPLREGDLLPVTVVFEKAGAIVVEATVAPIGARGPDGSDHPSGSEPKAGGSGSGSGSGSGAHKH